MSCDIYINYCYPEKLYKLGNQYMNGSKNWLSPKLLEKLDNFITIYWQNIQILVYIAIILIGIKIALNARDRMGTYLASGITSVIAIQLLINIAVVTGSIPPTGIPMPFISAGGTSLSVFMGAIGVLMNVGREKQDEKFLLRKNAIKLKLMGSK